MTGSRVTSRLLDGIPHGFSDRHGLSAHDLVPGPGAGAGEVRVKQVHGAAVMAATEPFAARPEADGLVTATPGLVLSIVTADCAPVLLSDAEAGVVAAVHAGWRGAVLGIAGEAVAAMERLGAQAERIRAAIGPCIHQRSYEVDAAMRDRFAAPDADRFFSESSPDRWLFDLPGFVASRLAQAGVGACDILPFDTYRDAYPGEQGGGPRFHSYRRASHEGGATGGRQVSMIALGPVEGRQGARASA